MRVRFRSSVLVVTAESDEERTALREWVVRMDGHVLAVNHQDERSVRLTDLGPQAAACRVPLNITSATSDPSLRLISNLAHTPFELDGRSYASVEAFWQGLKFPDEAKRQEIAGLHGQAARTAGRDAAPAAVVEYRGEAIRVGTYDHWRLMEAACRAKFAQHREARQALVATGGRPLVHRTRRDSRNIPGVLMSDIWMRIRSNLIERDVGAGRG